MLDNVCMYIADNYNNNSFEYFEQEDDEDYYSTEELIDLIREKLISVFQNDIQITDIDYEYKISFKFIYKGIHGKLVETNNRRFISFWLVDFIVD